MINSPLDIQEMFKNAANEENIAVLKRKVQEIHDAVMTHDSINPKRPKKHSISCTNCNHPMANRTKACPWCFHKKGEKSTYMTRTVLEAKAEEERKLKEQNEYIASKVCGYCRESTMDTTINNQLGGICTLKCGHNYHKNCCEKINWMHYKRQGIRHEHPLLVCICEMPHETITLNVSKLNMYLQQRNTPELVVQMKYCATKGNLPKGHVYVAQKGLLTVQNKRKLHQGMQRDFYGVVTEKKWLQTTTKKKVLSWKDFEEEWRQRRFRINKEWQLFHRHNATDSYDDEFVRMCRDKHLEYRKGKSDEEWKEIYGKLKI